MRKEGSENLTLTGCIKDKRGDREKTTYLVSLCKWMLEQGLVDIKRQNLLKATNYGESQLLTS